MQTKMPRGVPAHFQKTPRRAAPKDCLAILRIVRHGGQAADDTAVLLTDHRSCNLAAVLYTVRDQEGRARQDLSFRLWSDKLADLLFRGARHPHWHLISLMQPGSEPRVIRMKMCNDDKLDGPLLQ